MQPSNHRTVVEGKQIVFGLDVFFATGYRGTFFTGVAKLWCDSFMFKQQHLFNQ
jgi:hypothetical protein